MTLLQTPIRAHLPPRRPRAFPGVLPPPRGSLSEQLLAQLRRPTGPAAALPGIGTSRDALTDDDLHLALYLCYELHYRGLPGVDERWEWEPSLLGSRRVLEDAFLGALTGTVGAPAPTVAPSRQLADVVAAGNGPSLSRHLLDEGTYEQFVEFLVHRSAYQLKEADPHTWAIPRLTGRAKAAMVEIQADEYGGGDQDGMHSTLFARTMEAAGLDASYGAYLDAIPGSTLATVNLVSMFGLHRRWRGALVGHLAVFEMTSVLPMGRYAAVTSKLGLGSAARRFYDVHVEADAHHEVLAGTELVGGLAAAEPALGGDILFGARAVMAVEERFAARLLDCWAEGRSSLRQ